MKKLLLVSLVAGLASAAFAAPNPATATFEVKLIVQKACSVIAGASSDLDFGTQDPTATNLNTSNTIKVTCSKNTPYEIGLVPSNGLTTGAGAMKGVATPANTVAYQLNQTSNGTAWGDATGNRVSGSGDGTQKTHTVYGKVADVANAAPDTYKDLVTVNVRY
jgi:spore coat protein U-like protein